jgi:hypothetical protein
LSTANPGSPKESESQRGIPLILALSVGGLALVFMLLMGPRILTVLTGLLDPPLPPLPAQVTELAHLSAAHGADRWEYSSPGDVCQLVAFYRPLADSCPVLPPDCGGTNEPDPDFQAYCTGSSTFSVFSMRWRMRVPLRSVAQNPLRFELERSVSWDASLPPEALN